MNPKYPIYIISKGRWEKHYTVKCLVKRNIPFRIVVEPQEFDQYASVIDKKNILVLPFSNLGLGGIPARNWVWEHSIMEGHTRHWILDDNIFEFYRFTNNIHYRTTDGAAFAAIESFCDRYENLHMAGMQYKMFAPRRETRPKVLFNTRVYSCILLSNSIDYRWRGRYNEDTDLSLRILKDGFCTALFYAFICDKSTTMKMKGGNTDSLYKLNSGVDGRLLMAQSLKRQHPDVVTIVRKWGRWQHHVDYRRFKGNKLIMRDGVNIDCKNDEFGMTLRDNKTE